MLEHEIRGEGPESGSGHLLVFAVDNISVWEERLKGAGVPIADRTLHTLYFRDPDGHRVGLSAYAF
jgi:catechol 2,3-dioxygenase-like lactoylglutathione lyase family enzyme